MCILVCCLIAVSVPLLVLAAPPAAPRGDRGTRLMVNADVGPADMSLRGVAPDWVEPGEGFSMGARARYITLPDAAFDAFVLNHSSFNSYSVGLEFGMDGPARSRVIFGLDYSDLSMPPGNWRADGELPVQASYTEVSLHLISMDAMFLWKARFSDSVGFIYGVGLGVGYLAGGITSVNVLPTCTSVEQVPNCPHWNNVTSREQDIPLRVIPIAIAQIGIFYDPAPSIRIRIEGGVRNMIYTGMSVRSTF
jgi:hypothetical protein